MKKLMIMSLLTIVQLNGMQVARSNSGNILHLLVACNDEEQVISLLESCTPELINARTYNGSTALHIAVSPISSIEHRQVEKKKIIIKALLDKGINKNLRDNTGSTAYDLLMSYNYPGKFQLLTLFTENGNEN